MAKSKKTCALCGGKRKPGEGLFRFPELLRRLGLSTQAIAASELVHPSCLTEESKKREALAESHKLRVGLQSLIDRR